MKLGVHHYEPESKAQGIAWRHPTLLVAKKFKIQPSAGKLMLTHFWSMVGAILVHFAPQGETVKSDFRMFGPVEEAIRRRFSSREEVQKIRNT
jgi:hypothetical protein